MKMCGRSVNIILFIQYIYIFNLYSISGRPIRRDYFHHTQIFVTFNLLLDIEV